MSSSLLQLMRLNAMTMKRTDNDRKCKTTAAAKQQHKKAQCSATAVDDIWSSRNGTF